MPTKVPKGTGTDRSGRGNAVSMYPGDDAGKWQQNPRQKNPWIGGGAANPSGGAGGSPSMSADQGAAQKMGGAFFGPDTPEAYDGGDDVLWPRETKDVGECGFSALGGHRCPQETTVSENLLRSFIRQSLTEVDNRTGALGVWGRATTDWEDTPKPNLGSPLYNLDDHDPDAPSFGVCVKSALTDIDQHPERVMMKGPPGYTGDTSHFWTEYEGEVFDSSGRAPDGYEYLGKVVDPLAIRKELEENKELLAEPDEEEDDPREDGKDMDEFSGVGAVGGYSQPLGKSGPTFGRKRKKPENAVRGFKPTHG